MSNTARKIEHTRVEWDDKEEDRLGELAALRRTDEEITEILNKEFKKVRPARTMSSVINKRHSLNYLKSKPRGKGGTAKANLKAISVRQETEAMLGKPAGIQATPQSQVETTDGGINKSYAYLQVSLAGTEFDAILALVSNLKSKGFFCTVVMPKA